MTVAEIKEKQYQRFDSVVPDGFARALIRHEKYLLVTEEELNELAKGHNRQTHFIL